ncbi:hypothetical protein GOP47_0007615 [Adiantum capillus-veneris]|uniref:40S ribosomal protein S8 n=1 Tax=Adiantum capillus-veneris TaxID=13818 RepID=A0A9D4V116_ADICA|nr:hypothetical protein GOP47_0007615 [Adiantum capillus-veneris]
MLERFYAPDEERLGPSYHTHKHTHGRDAEPVYAAILADGDANSLDKAFIAATYDEVVTIKTFLDTLDEHAVGAMSSSKTVDAAPFRQWYSKHYGVDLGKKKRAASAKKEAEDTDATACDGEKKQSKHVEWKISACNEDRKLDAHLEDQIASGRLLACISSRPGQCGRADGYILEGKELEFYKKKIQRKKGKGTGAAA